MCATCGCDGTGDHDHHGHGHAHHHHDHETRTLKLEADLLAKNDRLAMENRAWLDARRVFALNVMGAPGAGKTALLEALLGALVPQVPVAVLEGDQDTDRDAARVRAAGAPVVQINTGAGCHLDAHMVRHGLDDLRPAEGSILFIENVGNLVCPALFDLGEHDKVVVMSVTEGDDKPLKYPHMFRGADVLVLNKIDLLEHVDFDVDRVLGHARELAPDVRTFTVSARRGDGIEALCAWLRSRLAGREPDDAHLRRDAERIDELLEELPSMVGPLAWQRIEELMQATVGLYGAGLSRVLAHARSSGAAGPAFEARLGGDELVSSLLRLHGLHPVPAESRARAALARAAEALASHGVAVSHVEAHDAALHVRVEPTDADPAAGTKALALIERVVHEAAPELSHVKVEGLPEAPARLVQIGLGPPRGAAR